MHTPLGTQEIDLEEAAIVLRGLGAEPAYTPIIERETVNRIPAAVTERLPDKGYRFWRRAEEVARSRWDRLRGMCSECDPHVDPTEVQQARTFFEERRRALSRHAWGPAKPPVPDAPDLRIMLQASKPGPPPAFILSRDAHFTGYADLIRERFAVEVLDARRLPLLLDEWRGPDA